MAHDAPAPLTVAVVMVEPTEAFDLKESYAGLAEARRTSMLGFASSGRIAAIKTDVGDKVKTGALMAKLDTRSLEAQLASANAQVQEARASHDLALSTVQRQRQLKLQGHVSQQHVDEAEAQANTALARVEAAKAQADTLRVQIDLAAITAPFDGVVTQRLADEGAIAALASRSWNWSRRAIWKHASACLRPAAALLEPGKEYKLGADTGEVMARLRNVTGVIDANQRTVGAVFDIEDPDASRRALSCASRWTGRLARKASGCR